MIQPLQEIKTDFDTIQNAIGNDKLPAIQQVWNNETSKELLGLLLNPLVTFGIGEKSLQKTIATPPSMCFDDLLSLCKHLDGRSSINDQDISNVQCFLNGIEQEDLRQFASAIITKTLTIGVTAKSVNKALGYEAIPQFSCMLANKYFDHPKSVDGKYFYLTLKMDGIRCLCVKRGGDIRFFSRQGQRIYGLIDLEAEVNRIPIRDFVLDGELLISGGFNMDSKDAYKATTKTVRKDGIKTDVDYHVFDFLDINDFDTRNSMSEYKIRRNILDKIKRENQTKNIQIVPILYEGYDTNEILRNLDIVRSKHQEGVMINLADQPYQFTRTNALLKVKVMNDCDLRVTGVQEGSGKFKGMLGALVVDYKGNQVGVGSGLSDEMRELIWNDPSEYIGRVVTVQYFEETEDKDGKKSIRFPVFKELRKVGKEVSYS